VIRGYDLLIRPKGMIWFPANILQHDFVFSPAEGRGFSSCKDKSLILMIYSRGK
jgi:hypothetical protein